MNPNLVANVTLAGAAATAFYQGMQLVQTDHTAGGILLGASVVFFTLYELFPDSNKAA